ncbi:heterokaryon incompatibility protein-domain-containing protein [Podospora conica]|nr:heterokaryon incompatibility protein-domain-containing protein [Schizothecium conicum]
MRLINTDTLLLEEFYSEIPPYAILSHRWEEEEVTFADYPAQLDVLANGGTRKKGFGKIDLCIKQARLDDLDYCWVDTCCIDKSSSAELSEAINSMYAWYRDSAVCYVYLSDVNVTVSEEEHYSKSEGKRPGCPSWSRYDDPVLDQLNSSQWFTRGWTLQELLAPTVRIFYDVGWVPLLKMDDSSRTRGLRQYGVGLAPLYRVDQDDIWQEVIENVTGIDSLLMASFSPKSRDISIARKMSWASKRKTTRPEDMAYCLMGIFGVNMPLLYGEGGPKAFQRLQEEIIKQSDDHTIFYWRDPDADHSTFRGLLARSPVEFRDPSRAEFSGKPTYTNGSRNRDDPGQPRTDRTYGMTNKGLRISLTMVSSGEDFDHAVLSGDDEEIAILECVIRPEQRFFIVLARLSDHGHYARVDAYCLPRVIDLSDLSGLGSSRPLAREIFVQQEPTVHPEYMSSRMTAMAIGSDPAFEIISKFPERVREKEWTPVFKIIFRPKAPEKGSHSAFDSIPPSPETAAEKEWRVKEEARHASERFFTDRVNRALPCLPEQGYFNTNKPLATAVVRVVDLLPPGVPSIDFTISLRWKSKTVEEKGPYGVEVQFDKVHYTDIKAGPLSHHNTGWMVSPKALVWASSSGILRIGVREQAVLEEDRLVLKACFTWERNSAISERVDSSRSYVSPSRRLIAPGGSLDG